MLPPECRSSVKPGKLMSFITLPSPQIPVAAHAGVIVVGGGPAGVCAAIAAARNGASTILLEKSGCLGGTWTTGSMGWIIDSGGDGKGKLIGEIIKTLKERNGLIFDRTAENSRNSRKGKGEQIIQNYDGKHALPRCDKREHGKIHNLLNGGVNRCGKDTVLRSVSIGNDGDR